MSRRGAIVVCCLVVAFGPFCEPLAWGQAWPSAKLAPYVPSTKDVAQRMLRMAGVGRKDVVYDLGAGDGRVVVIAAQEFGARAVGIEVDNELCAKGQRLIKDLGLKAKARILCEDLLTVDFSDATVVTLYLTTLANAKLKPNLEKYLRKRARVVSYSFEIPGWKPTKTDTWKEERSRHVLYLYVR